MINLEHFISKYVTERDSSLFERDIQNNSENLTKAIKDKSMLVIGGAGSIGSSFIKACLQFKPSHWLLLM
jgi:FlaA1/EpsC-like NDP-sugar epimerase